MIESQFANTPKKPKLHGSKRRRKHFDVKVLPDRKAKGRYPKGQGFNKRTRTKQRRPMYVPPLHEDGAENIIWLRVKRS